MSAPPVTALDIVAALVVLAFIFIGLAPLFAARDDDDGPPDDFGGAT